MKCIFWVDGSAQIGLGHIYRAKTLADALRHRFNAHCSIATGADSGSLSPGRMSFERLHEIPAGGDIRRTFGAVLALLQKAGADLLIIDKPKYPPELFSELQRAREGRMAPAIAAFDAAYMPTGCVDVIIDANRDESEARRFKNSGTLALFGPAYAALATEFADSRGQLTLKDNLERITISMGGSDPNFISLMAYDAAKMMQHIEINIVMGAAAPETYIQELSSVVDKSRATIYRNLSRPELAHLFSNSDGCIVAGGVTMLEAAAVGLPLIVISQNPPQLENARILETRGAIVNAGLFSRISTQDILSILLKWEREPALRHDLSRKAINAVDGLGIDRICSALQEAVATRQSKGPPQG
ncbi:MAG: hypothetical protein JW941_00175 [Candidatus Coatesbacteria bacterium]|nr:hypothetical protein [Candidatus Coatesbacteria bacterium]